jgi:hypothetical protein
MVTALDARGEMLTEKWTFGTLGASQYEASKKLINQV